MRELRQGGKGRRTWAKSKKRYYTPTQILQIIRRNVWPYKTRQDFYRIRDLALASLLYLTSGRINEVLRLTKDQFRENEDDKDFLVCHDFWVSKRVEGATHPTPQIPMPRVGQLSPFTGIVEDYLGVLEGDDAKLFPFSKGRAWSIIDCITNDPDTEERGVWNHWFRAQSLSYHVNLLRSTIVVADMRGIENPQTLAHYYTGEWRQHKADLKK